MWVKWVCGLAAAACLGACGEPEEPANADGSPRLEEQWRLDGGLANPESVAIGPDGASLYVTNVAGEGEAKDGNGTISIVSTGGAMRERAWVSGLNAPKGIALHNGVFYVADIDEIVAIDAASGAIRARTPAPGAVFLNDVAVTPDGLVLVADSGTSRIYALRGGAASVWLENPLLESINGILPEGGRLAVTTMAGRLLSIDPATKEITTLAEGLGDADGVARVGDGWLVSEWPGLMHWVKADGSHVTLLDSRETPILLNDFLLVGDMLYQPNWEPSTLTAYRVVR